MAQSKDTNNELENMSKGAVKVEKRMNLYEDSDYEPVELRSLDVNIQGVNLDPQPQESTTDPTETTPIYEQLQ